MVRSNEKKSNLVVSAMSKAKVGSKAIAVHPETKRQMNIDAAVYNAVKDAIIKVLTDRPGIAFTPLQEAVVNIVKEVLPDFRGSIPWYTISIRLDLETKGIVETYLEKGKKLNRLKAL